MPNLLYKWMWNRMWNCTSKYNKIGMCNWVPIYYVNECGTECEIVHQNELDLNM